MKKSIWKFPLEVTDTQVIKMPVGAEILSCQVQNDSINLWALVAVDALLIERVFVIYGTGNPVTDTLFGTRKFIDTVQTKNGQLVWHVFELIKPITLEIS